MPISDHFTQQVREMNYQFARAEMEMLKIFIEMDWLWMYGRTLAKEYLEYINSL